jgi:hypothetical protein
MNNLDHYDYANIFNVYEDSDGFQFLNLMNSLKIEGELDPQLYRWDVAHSFVSVYELSNKYYNTPKLWWTILLANDIQNPFDIKEGSIIKILTNDAIGEIINMINKP